MQLDICLLWLEQTSSMFSGAPWTIPFPFGFQSKGQDTEHSKEGISEGSVCCGRRKKKVCVSCGPLKTEITMTHTDFGLDPTGSASGVESSQSGSSYLPLSLHPPTSVPDPLQHHRRHRRKNSGNPCYPNTTKKELQGWEWAVIFKHLCPILHSSRSLWFVRTTTRLGLPWFYISWGIPKSGLSYLPLD